MREVGRARSPVGLLHQAEAGKADISFQNATILPEIQNVFLVFLFLLYLYFLFMILKNKLAENQGEEKKVLGKWSCELTRRAVVSVSWRNW